MLDGSAPPLPLSLSLALSLPSLLFALPPPLLPLILYTGSSKKGQGVLVRSSPPCLTAPSQPLTLPHIPFHSPPLSLSLSLFPPSPLLPLTLYTGSIKKGQGVLVEILSSMLDGSVPPSLIQTVYVCLALVLVVGMAGLLVAEASRWYLVGLVFFVAGFFISFSWYEPSLFPSISLFPSFVLFSSLFANI